MERLQDNALAVFACRCGAHKVLRVRNVVQGRTVNCADRRAHPDPRRPEIPSYAGMHRRVRLERGPARDHTCEGCGQRPARDWAYRHDSVDQLVQTDGADKGRVYAADVEAFWPLCRDCHRRWDIARATAAPRHALSLAHVALGMATSYTDTDTDHQEETDR